MKDILITSEFCRRKATEIRIKTLEMVARAKSGHLGSTFSCVDLLTILYFRILSINPKESNDRNRDRFILSKGHACSALYVILAERGFFPKDLLKTFIVNGGLLAAHSSSLEIPGIELAVGSLGHGLSVGIGMALAAKHAGNNYRIFVLISDGECDEGSTWEAILSAAHHRLDNLIVIVDYNKIQAFGRIEEVLNLEPLADKWRAFNWAVREINGHNHSQIIDTLEVVPFEPQKPSVVIAHTVKGKGVSFMENTVEWHYLAPTEEHVKTALKELRALL